MEIVGVVEGESQTFGEKTAHGRLAGTRHAHHEVEHARSLVFDTRRSHAKACPKLIFRRSCAIVPEVGIRDQSTRVRQLTCGVRRAARGGGIRIAHGLAPPARVGGGSDTSSWAPALDQLDLGCEGRHDANPAVSAAAEAAARFRSSFEENAPFVRRTLRRLGIPPADSEDLVQEIFVVVHRKLGEYDGRSPFRSWLHGICVRVVSSYRRSARVRYERPQADSALDDRESQVASDPERNAEVRRACLLLEALLIRLDDDKRNVFVLFELEGIAMTKIAKTVGCPLQTAYSRLHAARKALRTLSASAGFGAISGDSPCVGVRRNP